MTYTKFGGTKCENEYVKEEGKERVGRGEEERRERGGREEGEGKRDNTYQVQEGGT